ncbi:MAG: DNA mismatch repair protein MutH, partial [Nitrososphaerales archaeon]
MQKMIKSDLARRIKELCKDTANLEASLLVSATYDGERRAVLLKLYHQGSQKIYRWYDNTNHRPYCYSKEAPEVLKMLEGRKDILGLEVVKKHDLFNDREIPLTKIVARDPLAIGGTPTSIRNRDDFGVWEADIKYHENYLYDNRLIAGTWYSINNGKLTKHSYKV